MGPEHAFAICLVDHKNVSDLHDAGFNGLNVVTHARHQYDHRDISGLYDLNFVLADADRFDNYFAVASRIEDRYRIDRRSRKPAEISTGRHRSNEDILIQPERGHTDTIAEYRAARKWRRRIDADDADAFAFVLVERRELVNERGFACSGSPGNAYHSGFARQRINGASTQRHRHRRARPPKWPGRPTARLPQAAYLSDMQPYPNR